MCLLTNTSIPTILKKDLVVYKVFYEENGKIYSPFKNMKYDIGKLYYDEKIEINPLDNTKYTIHKAYHSCLTKRNAKWYLKIKDDKQRIYKCIIPRGSKVFFGTGILSNGDITSDTIIIKRRLLFNRW